MIGEVTMQNFNEESKSELKSSMYNSNVHDATIEKVDYSAFEHKLKISFLSSSYNERIIYTFCDVKIFLFTRGDWDGDSETVLGLTVEENISYLKERVACCDSTTETALYFVLEMFSGDEFHIVSNEVSIEIVKQVD